MLAGHTETMNCPLARLPQIYFINVGLNDFTLAVVLLQHQRHHCFKPLTYQRTILAEIKVFHQLLSQRTTALSRITRAHVIN